MTAPLPYPENLFAAFPGWFLILALLLTPVAIYSLAWSLRHSDPHRQFLPHLDKDAHSRIYIYHRMTYESLSLRYCGRPGSPTRLSKADQSTRPWTVYEQIEEDLLELQRGQRYLLSSPHYRNVSQITTLVSRHPLTLGSTILPA